MRRFILLVAAVTATIVVSAFVHTPAHSEETGVRLRITSMDARPVEFKIAYWSDIRSESGYKTTRTPFEVNVNGRDIQALVVSRNPDAKFRAEIIVRAGEKAVPGRGMIEANGAAMLYRFPDRLGTAAF